MLFVWSILGSFVSVLIWDVALQEVLPASEQRGTVVYVTALVVFLPCACIWFASRFKDEGRIHPGWTVLRLSAATALFLVPALLFIGQGDVSETFLSFFYAPQLLLARFTGDGFVSSLIVAVVSLPFLIVSALGVFRPLGGLFRQMGSRYEKFRLQQRGSVAWTIWQAVVYAVCYYVFDAGLVLLIGRINGGLKPPKAGPDEVLVPRYGVAIVVAVVVLAVLALFYYRAGKTDARRGSFSVRRMLIVAGIAGVLYLLPALSLVGLREPVDSMFLIIYLPQTPMAYFLQDCFASCVIMMVLFTALWMLCYLAGRQVYLRRHAGNLVRQSNES